MEKKDQKTYIPKCLQILYIFMVGLKICEMKFCFLFFFFPICSSKDLK